MASRYKGAKPKTVIYKYIINKEPIKLIHLTTNPDRSVDGDYKKNKYMYWDRVLADTGFSFKNATYGEVIPRAKSKIKYAKLVRLENFSDGLVELKKYTKLIENKGGKVILIRMPSGGLIWEYGNRWKNI